MVTRLDVKFALLLIALFATSSGGQQSNSIVYLRLSPQVVQERLQPPSPSQPWSDVLRQQYAKAAIPFLSTARAIRGGLVTEDADMQYRWPG
jgi:hypothetical protein